MITISDTIKDEKSCNYLKDYNEFFQLITRKLYVARFHHGMSVNEAKSYFIANYKISAREFNSVRNQLEARIKSLIELNKIAIDELKHQIAAIESGKKSRLSKNKKSQSLLKSIATYRSKVKRWKLERKGKRPKPPKSIDKIYEKDLYQSIAKNNNWIKQKDIRLKKLIQNLKIKENEIGKPKICFGSRNMFKKQFNLGDNGYKNHNDWKEDWRWNRSRESFFIGSSDETNGNQNAQYKGGNIHLRVPVALREKYGEYCKIPCNERLGSALNEAITRSTAISYRFVEKKNLSRSGKETEEKTMYVMASFSEQIVASMSGNAGGTIGVDLNEDHIAVCAMDRCGNPVCGKSYFFNFRGKRSTQISAILGDHVADIVQWAKESNRSIAIEKLDFRKKKKTLRESCGKRMRSMLSSFAYSKFHSMIKSRCTREGVALDKENPAWSSLIGKVKFAGYAHMFTSHEMAALAIARRSRGFSERPKIKKCLTSPDRMREVLGEFCLEDWTGSNQIKHIWSFWSRHKRLLSSLGPEYKIHQKEWERKLTLLSNHPSGFTAHREVVDSVFDLSSSGLRRGGSSPLRSIQVSATLTVRVVNCAMQYELT